jgi:hypothetical protein
VLCPLFAACNIIGSGPRPTASPHLSSPPKTLLLVPAIRGASAKVRSNPGIRLSLSLSLFPASRLPGPELAVQHLGRDILSALVLWDAAFYGTDHSVSNGHHLLAV